MVALAHEMWFVDRVPPADPSFAWQPLTLFELGAAVAVVLVVRALARVRAGIDVPALARLWPWMPFAVRIHLGVSLVGFLAAGSYLAPHLDLPDSPAGWVLGALMATSSALVIAGWHTRVAAAALVAAGPLGMVVYGVGPIVQRADVLALALFLVVAGPGRWSADWELGREEEAPPWRLGEAVWALRLATGGALVAVAFAEKLLNPDLALQFLSSQDAPLNVPAALGLPVSDLEFVRLAGAVEVLFGLLIVSGALPQAVVVVAGVPFNVTLYFFGLLEMLGHLPVYAAMLVLLVYGSHPGLRPWCSRLWPWGVARPAAAR